jgi:phosphoribosylamine--glycine ligase
MKHILVVGSGARECMIIKKLKQSNEKINISCIGTTRNPYIDKNTLLYITSITKQTLSVLLTIIGKIDYVIIGPEMPLKDGLVDYFESAGIPCIGPLKYYAQIETSKIFARKFIESINLSQHSPNYIVVDDTVEKINEFINKFISSNKEIVIKKDGLCGGKGVMVQGVDFKTLDDVQDILSENTLIEEKLIGEEFSLMSITDGNGSIRHFPPIQDYKRLLEGDLGPNTGSMGCLIDKNNSLPFLNDDDITLAQTINTKIIRELNKNGKALDKPIGYRGILYGSYIKTRDSLKIIEFNSRLGDPEGIMALSLLENNFLEICDEIAMGDLNSELSFSQKAMIGIYLVPKSYPQPTNEKFDIYISPKINKNNLIYGSVEQNDEHLYSLSSRSLFYFVDSEDLALCYNTLYANIHGITGHLKFRSDIGSKYVTKL